MNDRYQHTVPNCTGTWIDISTLTAPLTAMCSECRAVRSIDPDDQGSRVEDKAPVQHPQSIGVPWRLLMAFAVLLITLSAAAAITVVIFARALC